MKIENCNKPELDIILKLYNEARLKQTQKNMVIWPIFNDADIKIDIDEKRVFKIVMNDEIACVFTITFDDKDIWGEDDDNNAIYIHKIAGNSNYRGNNFIAIIIDWSKNFAKLNNRKFIRLDTVGNNTTLIKYYTDAGFTFKGMKQIKNTTNLPEHYTKDGCCYFEMIAT